MTDDRRVAVWEAMADHFLDTETRHDIPLTALRCVQAGLSIPEARDVWRYEVSPAVGFNVWDMAGEWGAWDRKWLVERIEKVRARRPNRAGVLAWLGYRVRVHAMHGVWLSIERCMELLPRAPSDAEPLARDLATIARHYFDFIPEALDAPDRERLRQLYPEPVQRLMEPVLGRDEAKAAHLRVQSALGAAR
ncbi:MAG TPA: hypothetical protein VND93_07735 [Myxococcales bacterium]|nr:hypothetical protein [Myxococcales bacterium]